MEAGTVLVLAPCLQLAFFVASGVSFETHADFAFLTGIPALYLIGAFTWWLLRRRGRSWRDVGWDVEGWPREAVLGAAAGLGVMTLVAFLGFALEPVLPSAVSPEVRPRWAALVYGFGLVTAFAPIEELVWRGWAFHELRDLTGSRWLAVALCSAAFGLLHWWGGPGLMVTATAAGAAYAAVYLWRETLVAAVVAHFVADLPLFVFMFFRIQPPQ